MLRKRTSFKPNLKQVAPSLNNQTSESTQSTTTSTTTATTTPSTSTATTNNSTCTTNTTPTTPQAGQNQKDKLVVAPQADAADVANDDSAGGEAGQASKRTPVQEIPDVASNQRVQEAITQLTGQKFEPIKLLSLRSSANKNVKIKDLLFFNPPMTKDQKRHKKSVCLIKKNEQQKKNLTSEIQPQQDQQSTTADKTGKSDDNNTTSLDLEADKMDTQQAPEEHSLVPKVKMGPEGQLILDESSMIINRKNMIKEQEAIVEDNEDIISRTNYDSFRRRPSTTSQTKWSLDDTKKFYQALTILGTDFSMMESLLFTGLRSRTELHKKFKREERVNKLKIDIALSNRISLNSAELEDLREVFYKQ